MWWTESDDARLRELAAEGKSASQIAEIFGNGMTRCAILGRAYRINGYFRKKPIFWTSERLEILKSMYYSAAGYSMAELAAHFRTSKVAIDHQIRKIKYGKMKLHGKKIAKAGPRKRKPCVRVTGKRKRVIMLTDQAAGIAPVTLLDLKENQCRWPVATFPHLFCGADKTAASPYCGRHHVMAYQPSALTEVLA